ncbi:hypothetical protein AVEN_260347-1 [Araneus ventricosus]|uniref:Uncharacterized protein n=1 Tax=Araneus ventricosus TaxID=182803 RepID=A0A4Y2K786_ARAVE|nr:hypothetical protein AVEN_260347-1 [Araneus ventricosus]
MRSYNALSDTPFRCKIVQEVVVCPWLNRHYCFNGWWIPGVASRSTIVQAVAAEPDSLKQGSTHGTCVQINETASVGTELVNINPESSNENYLYNQVTYAEDQPTYSSQDYTTGGATNQLMAMNSEQNNVEVCAISGLNNPALFRRNELGANDCNMEMRQSSETSSKIDRLTSMVCQLGLDGDNLNIPSVPISSNNKPDIVPVSGAINCIQRIMFRRWMYLKMSNWNHKFKTILRN